MLGVHTDGSGIGEFFVLPMAREADVVVVVSLGELGRAGASMGVMTVVTGHFGLVVSALLHIDPLLMMLPGMCLGVAPDSGFELIIFGQGFSKFIGFIVFVIPGKFKGPIRNANPS